MWKQIENKDRIKTFQFKDEPELIHIIKTGYEDLFIIVHEDGYELNTGLTELLSAKSLKEKFGIEF